MKSKLGIGNNQTYALRDKEGNATRNIDKVVKVPEQFCRDLYGSDDSQYNNGGESCPDKLEIPPITADEEKKL